MKEEWRNVVVEGKEHYWYEISNYGVLKSHLRREEDMTELLVVN